MNQYYIFTLILLVFGFATGVELNCNTTITIPCSTKNLQPKPCYDKLNDLDVSYITDNTCISIEEDQTLDRVLTFKNLNHIKITSTSQNLTTIHCGNASGLEFLAGVQNIQITHLEFASCGHSKLSTSIPPNCPNDGLNTTTFTLPTPNISAAIFFYDTQNIELDSVDFRQSVGYSIAMYNVTGHTTLYSLTFQSNSILPYVYNGIKCPGYASGGGVYVEYTKGAHLTTHKSVISMSHCQFIGNNGDNVTSIPDGLDVKESHIGFGRGGAFSVVVMGNASINVTISNCTFQKNKAAWGGGMYVRFRDNSSNCTFHIRNSTFEENYAEYSGGAIMSSSTQTGTDRCNKVFLETSHFQMNKASVGGAIALKHYVKNEHISAVISNSQFVGNQANLGSVINARRVNVQLSSVAFKYNEAFDQGTSISGQGAIYAFLSQLFFEGTSEFVRNHDTSLVSDCTETHIRGKLQFLSNSGENGGGISLYGESHLIFYDETDLLFANNSAFRRGGAIYVEFPGASIHRTIMKALRSQRCFFLFNNSGETFDQTISKFKGKVKFNDNHADVNGDSIFLTSFDTCTSETYANNQTFIHWPGFEFSPDEPQIATKSVRIWADPKEWLRSPGEVFKPNVVLFDEIDNHVSEPVNVEINSKNVQIESSNRRFIVDENDKITLTLIGDNQKGPQNFDVTISLVSSNYISYTIYNRTLNPCYFGYTLIQKRCKCNVMKNQAKGIAFCIDNKIYLYKNRWANPKQKAVRTDNEVTSNCPQGYCKDCTKFKNNGTNKNSMYGQMCLYNPSNPDQCVDSRKSNSTLCSECKAGLSVQMGGEDCVYCTGSNKWAFFKLLLLFFCIFTMVSIAILLNLDIYKTYLNGFFYYYQVAQHLTPVSFTTWPFTGFISGITNLQSGGSRIKFCLFNDFNNLQKLAFNYFLPVSMVLSLFLVSFLSRRVSFVAEYLSKKNCMKAFTIISVFAYQDITRISFLLLNYTFIDNNYEPYVWVYAKLQYFGDGHLPYAIFALLVVIFIVLGFPVCLFFSSELVGYRCSCCQNPFTQMLPVFENFNTCFKLRWFAGFYFIARAIIVAIGSFVPISPNQNVIQVLICCIVCFVFASLKPYKDKWLNVFDFTVLLNLVLVSIISLTMRSYVQVQLICTLVINILMLIPFVVVSFRLCFIYIPLCFEWIKKKHRRYKYGE